MVGLKIDGLRRILCLGAHSDDIEIGAGGTLLTLLQGQPGFNVTWIVFSAEGKRANEARASARYFLKGSLAHQVVIHGFRASFFPYQGEAIKETFEKLKGEFQPDLVLTHYRQDRHQDHRLISDLTWNTFRDHLILEYEIPKYDGDLGQPNCFMPLSAGICRKKVTAITRGFETQENKHWFTQDAFLGLMRLRGVECASPTRYAEAFFARKLVLNGGKKVRNQ
jgi:LmbE family N-acetylglucosaminyl deacetylase